MERLNNFDIKILHALQNHPLEPSSQIANLIGTSTQTIIRRIERLTEQGILRYAIASIIPERLGLVEYAAIIYVSSIDQMTLLQMAFTDHPYTRYYSRFYGEKFGFYATFEVPPESNGLLRKFLDYLVENGFCKSYTLFRSEGHRIAYPDIVPNYTLNPKCFNMMGYWEKRLQKPNRFQRLASTPDLSEFTPLHLLLLREITKNLRTSQADLVKKFKNKIKGNKTSDPIFLPDDYFSYMKEFLENKADNTIRREFNKVYNYIKEGFIARHRWNVNRKFTETFVYRAFVIKDIPQEEKAQLFNLFLEERPPFRLGCTVLSDGLFLTVSLPPYYDAKFSYLVWTTFGEYKMYSMDFFRHHGHHYWFYVDNFDITRNKWKTDEDWMFNNVVDSLNQRLKEGRFNSNY